MLRRTKVHTLGVLSYSCEPREFIVYDIFAANDLILLRFEQTGDIPTALWEEEQCESDVDGKGDVDTTVRAKFRTHAVGSCML